MQRPAGQPGPGRVARTPSDARSTPAAVPDSSGPEPGSLPPSLEGTVVAGDLRVDGNGRFLPDPDALRFLDYWAQARGEEPAQVLRGRVEREVAVRLPGTARADALAAFDAYLRYLAESRVLEAESTDPDALAAQYAAQRELRERIFGPATAYALFREQVEVERVTLERRRIMTDTTLTDRQRIARLAELRARLPEEIQEEEVAAYSDLRLSREDPGPGPSATEDAYEPGASGEVPSSEASWATRMAAYREERDRVLYNVRNAPEEAKSVFLRRVRERHFEVDEIPRVEALDRIELRDRTLGRAPIPRSP